MTNGTINHHGTVIAIDGRGILIEGASGSGKSALALTLLRDAGFDGRQARLVADDQIYLRVDRNRLVASAPPAIAGMIEMRGTGLLQMDYLEESRLDLAVRMSLDEGSSARMPDPDAIRRIEGCDLPQLSVARSMVSVSWTAISLALMKLAD